MRIGVVGLSLLLAVGCAKQEVVYLDRLPADGALGAASAAQPLTVQRAIEVAMAHAGFTVGDVRLKSCDTDQAWGRTVYEVEFEKGWYKYEYDVDVQSGQVLKMKKEFDW